jgi:hypothetical protein
LYATIYKFTNRSFEDICDFGGESASVFAASDIRMSNPSALQETQGLPVRGKATTASLYQARATRTNYSWNILQISCQAGRRDTSARQAPAKQPVNFLSSESPHSRVKI